MNCSSLPLSRQLTGHTLAPSRLAAATVSSSRWQFWPSQSSRSPWPTPSAASSSASRLARWKNSACVCAVCPQMVAVAFG